MFVHYDFSRRTILSMNRKLLKEAKRFWSAVTCHRFRPSRPVATLLATGRRTPKRLPRGSTDLKQLRSLRLVPGVNGFAAREVVKDHINAGQHFRQQDDLSGVHREMLCHMKDRCEGGRGGALYRIFIE